MGNEALVLIWPSEELFMLPGYMILMTSSCNIIHIYMYMWVYKNILLYGTGYYMQRSGVYKIRDRNPSSIFAEQLIKHFAGARSVCMA